MKNYNRKLKIFYFLVVVFSFSFLVFSFCWAQNASLYLSPSAGSYTVGNTFLVQLKVNSGGVAINAADGTLIFDPDKLEVKSISKTDSIFTLWVQEPIFSNSVGTINFAGGKPSPGFTGAAGTIINITFKAKTAGTTNLTFAAGSVLADDGKGTNILANMGSGTYRLTTREITPLPPTEEEEEYVPSVIPGQAPVAPVVSSLTHPDENKWYSNNAPEFTWELPSDVTGVSLLLHKSATGNPGPISDGLIESKKFEDVEEGIWYFHIKFKNQYGWGKITHRKVLIDITPPEPFEIEVQREDPTNPQPVLVFETIDKPSGIEYYEVKIGEGEPFSAEELKTESYKLPFQAPGIYPIEITAFDKAGNSVSATTEIEILPIETPTLTKFPRSLGPGQTLVLEGRSSPEVKIKVFVQKEKEEPVISEIKANTQGKWSFLSPETFEEGEYQIWVQAQDERGALSLASPRISLGVGLPPFLKFGKIAISYSIIMITLIVLIVGVVTIILYAWYRVSLWRKRLRKETKEIAQSVAKAFRALREEVQEEIEYLDKKPGLSKAEKEIRDKLQKALNISEEFIGKEIKDVEKELE